MTPLITSEVNGCQRSGTIRPTTLVEWLRKLVRSRLAQMAVARQGEQAALRLTDGGVPPSRLAKMLAKSFYKDMAAAGFSSGQIIEAASEIIGQISGDLSRHKKRLEREGGED